MNFASYLPGKLPFNSNKATDAGAAGKSPVRSKVRRPRFLKVLGFFAFWTVAICLKLVWLQVVRHGVYVDKAQHQQQHTIEIEPRRGILYDRNLRELAVSTLADSVISAPLNISSPNSTLN